VYRRAQVLRLAVEIPLREIHQAKVLLTMLEGKEVYRDPNFAVKR
jgi:hypothetical protein